MKKEIKDRIKRIENILTILNLNRKSHHTTLKPSRNYTENSVIEASVADY